MSEERDDKPLGEIKIEGRDGEPDIIANLGRVITREDLDDDCKRAVEAQRDDAHECCKRCGVGGVHCEHVTEETR